MIAIEKSSEPYFARDGFDACGTRRFVLPYHQRPKAARALPRCVCGEKPSFLMADSTSRFSRWAAVFVVHNHDVFICRSRLEIHLQPQTTHNWTRYHGKRDSGMCCVHCGNVIRRVHSSCLELKSTPANCSIPTWNQEASRWIQYLVCLQCGFQVHRFL